MQTKRKLYVPLCERGFEEDLEEALPRLNEQEIQTVIILCNRAFDAGCVESLRPKTKE